MRERQPKDLTAVDVALLAGLAVLVVVVWGFAIWGVMCALGWRG